MSVKANISRHKTVLVGIDEAGRGPLAGPVTAACVACPHLSFTVRDSKKLTARQRERLSQQIRREALAYAIVSVGPRRIEILNIREATRLAMLLALERVAKQLDGARVYALIDGNTPLATERPQETIVKGDDRVQLISAASILAKVERDRLMLRLHRYYPNYGLDSHKGYPTKSHREKVAQWGPSQAHRRTFAGVREHVSGASR